MKRTKFQKITALALALTLLIGGGVVSTFAAESSGSETTAQSISELLNAISYGTYAQGNANVPRADSELTISAVEKYEFLASDGRTYDQDSVLTQEQKDSKKLAYVDTYDGRQGLYIPGSGTVTWTTDKILSTAKYSIVIDYYPVQNKSASVERVFMINGSVPFAEARYLVMTKVWENVYPDGEFALEEGESADTYLSKASQIGISARSEKRDDGKTYIIYKMPAYFTQDISELIDELALRFFVIDIDENEIRSSLEQSPKWCEYQIKDSNGFYSEPFEFVIQPDASGVVSLSLESVNEPVVISDIRLVPYEPSMSYADYAQKYNDAPEGTGKVKIEAEYYSATSSQTIYPIEDRTSAVTSPSSTKRTLLNTIGGEKWQTAGQWVMYDFSVDASGMYTIASRFRQNVLDGMYTSRSLFIYSDDTVAEGEDGYYNGLPFSEAANMRFEYSSDWQSDVFNDGETEFEFYFKEGVVYTLKIEVALGSMGQIVSRVQDSLDSINNDYLNILKLTGSNPDEYRDYGFARVMPDTLIDLILQSRTLYAVAEEIVEISDVKSSMTATLEKVAWLLERMGSDEDEIAKNLEQLKSYIGSLGTWLSDAKTQPLQLDYLVVQGASEELPKAKAGFWTSFIHEIESFIMSFFRNYNRMGATEEVTSDDSVEVWLAYGRDQSQVIRNLINNDFTPHTEIPVDLKLVAGSTLLPSILAGMGPDVYIGLAQSDVINYAIRGALIEIEDMDDFEESITPFNEAAMIVLGIEDSTGEFHYYGLPETQNFNMMFVREDILAELGIDVPRTWDDVLEAIPTLQANNMTIGMHTDYKVFLYQMGGELYADNGMRINLDSNVALESFETMCNYFTMYSFPYKYDFANRFRTGEMPIGFATYTATYNQLKVFATEIEGLWNFYPMPGYEQEDGSINNVSVSTVSAIVMISGCDNTKGAWEFMKWHVGEQCQTDYSNEMVAIIGPSAKHATANMQALESLPWTSAEYEQLAAQFNNLASIPNYPGSYIIDRYTRFAFLSAYNDMADPVTELQSYITTINKEITRKRQEFNLEVLDYVGQTLAQKRMTQAIAELEEISKSSSYSSSYDAVYNLAMSAMDGGNSEDFASIGAAADALENLNPTLFGDAVKYMRSAVDSLKSYEAYK